MQQEHRGTWPSIDQVRHIAMAFVNAVEASIGATEVEALASRMPPGSRNLIINGKFLRARMTGVHRVAFELCNAIAGLREEGSAWLRDRDIEVWYTRDGREAAADILLPVKQVGPFDSVAWEQITLPARQGEQLLLNLCNIGPMLSANSVTMIHDAQVLLTPGSYSRAFRLWYRLVQGVLGRRNHALLSVSDFSRRQIARFGIAPLDRIYTIHNGVDHVLRERADQSILARFGLSPGTFALGLSTTQEHKNIALLMKAFARQELAGMKLVLFGSANRADFFAAGLEVPPQVVFAGRVSNAELRALMEAACALVFPSTTEGFGLPPLEAMLLGTPSICAPCGALPEVCGDAALYADPNDAAQWAGLLADLAANPERRRNIGSACRAHAARFTWRSSAQRLVEVLDMIELTRPARHPGEGRAQ
ncbi:MAG: glycosyltransferase family 4 protein [Sphingomonadales bacterium]|nr:glycosyltransferase family 4 protein [Sphingomonadales bacterium]MDE2570496.1 glycosyltransferase family 4 protein [Sphingomonadales bacterium]